MSQTMNSKELIERVRQRVHDLSSRVYTDNEILQTADDELRTIFTSMRASGQSWGMDSFDTSLGAFQLVESGVYELELPSHVADVQVIEAIFAGTESPTPIPNAPMELKDAMRGTALIRGAVWHWARYGYAGAIQIRGSWAGALPTIRIWYLRGFGPLVYGTTASGTTTSLTIATTTGSHKNRTNIYTNMLLEVVADSAASNVGQIARVSTYSSGVLGLASPLPAAASSSTQWAIIVPMPPEYVDLLLQSVAVTLLARTASPEEYQIQSAHLSELKSQFAKNVTNRATGEPRRLYSSRMR